MNFYFSVTSWHTVLFPNFVYLYQNDSKESKQIYNFTVSQLMAYATYENILIITTKSY